MKETKKEKRKISKTAKQQKKKKKKTAKQQEIIRHNNRNKTLKVTAILTKESKKILREFIIQGQREKENLILREEDYELLKKYNLIKEEGTKVYINPEKITTIIENGEEHHFFIHNAGEEENNKQIKIEHLNDPEGKLIQFEVKTENDILPELYKRLEKKIEFENKINEVFR